MKSNVLYIGLIAAVILFAIKIFTASVDRRDEVLPQSSEQMSFIYHQAQFPLKSRKTLKR